MESVLDLFQILTSCFAFGQGVNSPEVTLKIESLPKDLEVHLALSAAPPHLRAGATVFVLDPARGYVIERQGKNGFTCYVQRTDYTREEFRKEAGPFGPWSLRSNVCESRAS